jgi:protein tyrosine phosphatase (PTP) superfamily phosphohydrolase (DUF442 family)
MDNVTHAGTRWLTTALAALLVACADTERDAQPPQAAVTASAPTLADVQAVGVQNAAMPLQNVVTAAQPTEEQLMALVDLGYTSFVSLRSATEEGAGWEEGIAADEGIRFARIPIEGEAGLTRENVLELDRVLTEAEEEGTVLYCSSSNRVGALLALRAYWLEGSDPQAALELGRRAGLSRLEPAVAELLAAPRSSS